MIQARRALIRGTEYGHSFYFAYLLTSCKKQGEEIVSRSVPSVRCPEEGRDEHQRLEHPLANKPSKSTYNEYNIKQ